VRRHPSMADTRQNTAAVPPTTTRLSAARRWDDVLDMLHNLGATEGDTHSA